MPLPRPERRRGHHRRTIICEGFEREDGLWDIDARMSDVKNVSLDNPERDGYVAAGEAFHDISVRVTIDQQFSIAEIHVAIDAAPFKMCPRIINTFQTLKGSRIGPGWLRHCREQFSGVRGCTHVNELFPVIATTAIQAIWPSVTNNVLEDGAALMLNSCHSWAQNSEIVERYLPQYFKE